MKDDLIARLTAHAEDLVKPDAGELRRDLHLAAEALEAASTSTRQQKQLSEEGQWVRRKLKLPEDASTNAVYGRMHVQEAHARGYVTYIEAFRCDDKQGEIARLTVRAEAAEAELTTLRASVTPAQETWPRVTPGESPQPSIACETLLETLAAQRCDGVRHEGFLGNCPVCLDRLLRLRRIVSADAGLLSAPAPGEPPPWQPIETGPNDGTRVVLFNPDEDESSWSRQIGGYYEELGGWQYDGQNPRYSHAHQPTRWMPLPSPPASAPAATARKEPA